MGSFDVESDVEVEHFDVLRLVFLRKNMFDILETQIMSLLIPLKAPMLKL